MPKKGKAKGGAKKGGAKAAKAVEVDLNPFSSVFNDPAQVMELGPTRERLVESEKIKADLQDTHRQLKEQLAQQEFEQSEIFAYLNKELVQKSKQVALLEARVQELSVGLDTNQTDFEVKLKEEKVLAQEMTSKLGREVSKYERELGDLNVFIAKKNELEGELEVTRTELLRRKHEMIISELERKTAFMRLTDNQLEATTKKTLLENEQMASELAFQNRETERLLLKNSKLEEENRTAKRELALHQQTESELARRNHQYLRTIKGLLGKLKALDEAKRDLERKEKTKEEKIVVQYRKRVTLLQDTVEEAYSQLNKLSTDLQDKTSQMSKVNLLREDVLMLLLTSADDRKRHVLSSTGVDSSIIEETSVPELSLDAGAWRPGDPLPHNVDDLSVVEQEKVIRYMHVKLEGLNVFDGPAARSDMHLSGPTPSHASAGLQRLEETSRQPGLFPAINNQSSGPGASKRIGARSEMGNMYQEKPSGYDSRSLA
ncbi:hypothetical protein T484DRAFT_2219579 [Baffinella frigidus]|nr:hypothetical protein T484DRAFT_2219579 [Cryptophyta sp. CCMP2293]